MANRLITFICTLTVIPCFAQSNLLQITSPLSGTIVYPGQVVIVSVSADPSVSNIFVEGEHPLSFWNPIRGQSLQFQSTIPSDATIGSYDVTALGNAADGSLAASPQISLQVDTPYPAAISGTEPDVLRMSAPGEITPLHVMGTLPDGSQADITHSLQMSYSSENPQIATVDSNGIVRAVTLGSTHIIVSNPTSRLYVSTEVGQLATMSFPGLAEILPGASYNFRWIGANEATAYRIQVGSTQGGNNYYDSGSLPTTTLSQTINTLPVDGSTIYVTLWTQINNQWANNQYYYTAPNLNISNITSPPKGSTLSGASATFTWTAARGATAYKLWVGSTPGGHDIDIATGSYPDGVQTAVHNLPTNGQVLYVSVYAFINGTWVAQDTAVYKAATV
jgi:hypothetical protein